MLRLKRISISIQDSQKSGMLTLSCTFLVIWPTYLSRIVAVRLLECALWCSATLRIMYMFASMLVELPRAAQSYLDLPRAARSCLELPGAVQSCQELPRAARSCQELPGAAQSCPEVPAIALRGGSAVAPPWPLGSTSRDPGN